MNSVTYKVGEQTFCFETNFDIIPEENLFRAEEQLMEIIKEHKHHLDPIPKSGFIHDVVYVSQNGIKATIKDFVKPRNLELDINL